MSFSLVDRIRLKIFSIWYGKDNHVVQADYMGCQILVRANEEVGKQILVRIYEKDDLTFLLDNIKKGDVFFDIGANVGLFSLVVAKKKTDVDIHAFEPIPLNAHLFGASLCLNDVESVTLNQTCVGASTGHIEFSLAADSAYSSMLDTGRKKEIRKITVPVTTLDSYCSNNALGRIDVMKIDVEGAEKAVLSGAENIFSRPALRPRLVLMELYDENLALFATSIESITEMMRGFGYAPFGLENGVKIHFEKKHYNKIYNVFFEI